MLDDQEIIDAKKDDVIVSLVAQLIKLDRRYRVLLSKAEHFPDLEDEQLLDATQKLLNSIATE